MSSIEQEQDFSCHRCRRSNHWGTLRAHSLHLVGVRYNAPYTDHIMCGGDCVTIIEPYYNRTVEAEMEMIFVNDCNQVLEAKRLDIANMPWPFVSSYHGEIRIYLGSPLPPKELEEKGCYGNWNVTFRLHHYPNLLDISPHVRGQLIRYSILGVGLIAIVTGLVLTKLSLGKNT